MHLIQRKRKTLKFPQTETNKLDQAYSWWTCMLKGRGRGIDLETIEIYI